jgi:hypothetical protein
MASIVVFAMPNVVLFTTSVPAASGVPVIVGSLQGEPKQKCELEDVISGGISQ